MYEKKDKEPVRVSAWWVMCELDNGKLMKVIDVPDFACEPIDEHLTNLEEVNFFDKSEDDKPTDIEGSPV